MAVSGDARVHVGVVDVVAGWKAKRTSASCAISFACHRSRGACEGNPGRYLCTIARGLADAHTKKVVSRDPKIDSKSSIFLSSARFSADLWSPSARYWGGMRRLAVGTIDSRSVVGCNTHPYCPLAARLKEEIEVQSAAHKRSSLPPWLLNPTCSLFLKFAGTSEVPGDRTVKEPSTSNTNRNKSPQKLSANSCEPTLCHHKVALQFGPGPDSLNHRDKFRTVSSGRDRGFVVDGGTSRGQKFRSVSSKVS